MSNGAKVENPRFLGKTQAKIRVISKQKRRKQAPSRKHKVKASRRWLKAQKQVSKLQRKVGTQRSNWIHQEATKIVGSNSLVATEKLNLKGMTAKGAVLRGNNSSANTASKKGKRKCQKSGLNRSVLDVGMGMFRKALEYKLAEAGGVFVEVPSKTVKPSQTCPNCGCQEPKSLDQRVHCCTRCSYTEDRDVAAAKVMLSWALGTSVFNRGEGSSTSVPKERKHCGGLKQLASLKRQKLQVQPLGDLE